MRKAIARGLVIVSVLTGLISTAYTPSASAHHIRRHHCRWKPHIHPKNLNRHPHHLHQCRGRGQYPPRYHQTAAARESFFAR